MPFLKPYNKILQAAHTSSGHVSVDSVCVYRLRVQLGLLICTTIVIPYAGT